MTTTYSSSNSNTKSRRAYLAESEGRFTASRIAKIIGHGVNAADVKDVLGDKGEWHHTGTYANRTNYYDGLAFMIIMGHDCSGYDTDYLDACDIKDAEEYITLIRNQAAQRKAKSSNVQKWKGCTVKWTEWIGSRRHPKRIDHEWTNCIIEKIEGKKFATISRRHTWVDQDGKKRWRLDTMKKNLSGNWIQVNLGEQVS